MRAVIVFGLCAQSACVRDINNFAEDAVSIRAHQGFELAKAAAPGINERGSTQFGPGGFQKAHVRHQGRKKNDTTVLLPRQWLDYLQFPFTKLGSGAFGTAYLTHTVETENVRLDEGATVKVYTDEVAAVRAYAVTTFSRWNDEGLAILANGWIVDRVQISYHGSDGAWHPLSHETGSVVLKEQEIGVQPGTRWEDYMKEVSYMRRISSPYTVPAFVFYPSEYHASHTYFWIGMPAMHGGEIDSSLGSRFQRTTRRPIINLINTIGSKVFGRDDVMNVKARNQSNLRDYIVTKHRLFVPIFLQILYGVKDVHAAGVVHCDLKPPNVLISARNCLEDPGACVAKVADFGVACGGGVASCRGHKGGTPKYWPLETFGTEIAQSERDLFPQDMWSSGMTIYEIWVGRLTDELEDAVQQSARLTFEQDNDPWAPYRSVLTAFAQRDNFPQMLIGLTGEMQMYPELQHAINILCRHRKEERNLDHAIARLEILHNRLFNTVPQKLTTTAAPAHLAPLQECAGRRCQYKCNVGTTGCNCPDALFVGPDKRNCASRSGVPVVDVMVELRDDGEDDDEDDDEEESDPGYYDE